MKVWDASAVLPLLLGETGTPEVQSLYEKDSRIALWCLTEVEVGSALARRSREGRAPDDLEAARVEWRGLADRSTEIWSVNLVRSRSLRLVNTHPLRAADALQLAAAIVASGERPEALPFVCLDDRLREAARREGFPVLPA